MRKLIPALVAAAIAMGLAGCKRPEPRVEPIEEGNQPARSLVHAADLRSAIQILNGIHQLENNTFRWTMGKFSVVLAPPPDAARNGARFEFRFVLPESVIERRKAVTLSVWVEGRALAPEVYDAEGEHTYLRDVPASAFAGEPVKVDFALDRYLKAGEVETRELGVLFTSAALIRR